MGQAGVSAFAARGQPPVGESQEVSRMQPDGSDQQGFGSHRKTTAVNAMMERNVENREASLQQTTRREQAGCNMQQTTCSQQTPCNNVQPTTCNRQRAACNGPRTSDHRPRWPRASKAAGRTCRPQRPMRRVPGPIQAHAHSPAPAPLPCPPPALRMQAHTWTSPGADVESGRRHGVRAQMWSPGADVDPVLSHQCEKARQTRTIANEFGSVRLA